MLITTVIAGPYAGLFTPSHVGSGGGGPTNQYIGILDDNGFELSFVTHNDIINSTDAYGATRLDGIYRGADFSIRFRMLEFTQLSLDIAWPWGRKPDQQDDPSFRTIAMGPMARRMYNLSGSLVLNVMVGTPADAAKAPTSLTAFKVIHSGAQVAFNFNSRLRTVPVDLILWPYSVVIAGSSYIVWFTTT